MNQIETERLVIRPTVEADRARLVELFIDETFMVFTHDALEPAVADQRFDRMLALNARLPYAKQPVIDKLTDTIVGYVGAGTVVFDGVDRLEWGWRLVPEVRGHGFAVEATLALLDVAHASDNGEMLCIIDVENAPSRRVAEKVGYRWWKQYTWADSPDEPTDLFTMPIGAGGAPLPAHLPGA